MSGGRSKSEAGATQLEAAAGGSQRPAALVTVAVVGCSILDFALVVAVVVVGVAAAVADVVVSL